MFIHTFCLYMGGVERVNTNTAIIRGRDSHVKVEGPLIHQCIIQWHVQIYGLLCSVVSQATVEKWGDSVPPTSNLGGGGWSTPCPPNSPPLIMQSCTHIQRKV